MAQVVEWEERQVGTIKGVTVWLGYFHVSFYTKSQIHLLFMVGFLDPLLTCGGGWFPKPTINSQRLAGRPAVQLSADTTQGHHQIPQGKGSVPQDGHRAAPIPGHMYFWLAGYKSEVFLTPSLVLISVLEQVTELRETFYLLDHWFVIRGYNSGTARWERCIGQVWGKGPELPCFSKHATFLQISTCHQPRRYLNPIL